MTIEQKFDMLGIDNAPGQEALQKSQALELRGEPLPGPAVDFSHGDVDAHIPTPGSFEVFERGVKEGAAQAYTPYRGRKLILEHVAKNLAAFTGAAIDPAKNLILTPGTQGALFLAMGSNMMPGDKVAIVEPDYFANRKMVEFFGGELVPIPMDYETASGRAGIDLEALKKAFEDGVKLFLFSNPNNPVGCVYSYEEITSIASMAKEHHATLIVGRAVFQTGLSGSFLYPSVRAEGDSGESDHDSGAFQDGILKRLPSGCGFRHGSGDRADGKTPGYYGAPVLRL